MKLDFPPGPKAQPQMEEAMPHHSTEEPPQMEIEETKRERFIRIGTARMNRVLDHIRLLGNLSNSNYEWTDHDLRTIQTAIADELNGTLTRFQKERHPNVVEFSFEQKAARSS